MDSQLHACGSVLRLSAVLIMIAVSAVAYADPLGGERPCLMCAADNSGDSTGASAPNHVATASGGSLSLSEGNLFESVPVGRIRNGTGTALEIDLVYNSYLADGSQGSVNTVLGRGWTHSYNVLLFEYRRNVFVIGATGRTQMFSYANGKYNADDGYADTLVKNPDGSFTFAATLGDSLTFRRITPAPPYVIQGVVPLVLSKIVDRNGNSTTLSYAAGLLAEVQDGWGNHLYFGYNADRKISSVTDSAGRVTTLAYEGAGSLRLWRITGADGHATVYGYNVSLQMTKKTDPNGNRFTFEYNAARKPVAVRDALGVPLFRMFNPSNWAIDQTTLLRQQKRQYIPSTTTLIDGNGNTWRYSYNMDGYITAVVTPDGFTTTYTYDSVVRRRATATDPLGRTTSYGYDARGNLTNTTDPLGHTTTYTYEPVFNRRTSMTDSDGRTTMYFYDAAGNRIAETDPALNTVHWTYDSDGNVLSTTDKNGNVTTFDYDLFGKQIQVTDALGNVTSMTYDAAGNVLSRTDALGRGTFYGYDGMGRQITVIDPRGGLTSHVYDGRGNTIETLDPNGHGNTFEFDHRNRLIRKIDALGHVESITYDGNGNPLSTTDANGHTTTYVYDAQNRRIRATDALGHATEWAYDPAGNTVMETGPNGNVTSYVYDGLDRRTRVIDALGGVTDFEHAGVGGCCGPSSNSSLVTKRTDANGKVTYYKYDDLDRMTREIRKAGDTADVVDADDAVTEYSYDANDNTLSVTAPNGLTTTTAYDALNRGTMVTDPVGDVESTAYDAVGNVKTVATPGGNVVTHYYDENDRLIRTDDNVGVVAQYTYDAAGNQLSQTDGIGNTQTFVYDAKNRAIREFDPMGEFSDRTFDPRGHVLTSTNREGHTTAYAYDAADRTVSATDPMGSITSFDYDAAGNLIRVTDAEGHSTQYVYDLLGRLIREVYADGGVRAFTYDAVGNPLTRTDQKSQVTGYTYNDLYFLTQRTYPNDAADVFTHDLVGRLLTAEKGGWLVTLTYDGADRLTQSVQNGQVLTCDYDTANRTRTIHYPGGFTVEEQSDLRERMVDCVDVAGASVLAHFVYDAADRLIARTALNGTAMEFGYDPDSRVTHITHSAGGPAFAEFRYAYDKDGNKRIEEKLHDPDSSETFAYDAAQRFVEYRTGQLVGDAIPLPVSQTSYSVDRLGNWTSKVTDGVTELRMHDPVNALIAVDGAPLLYDGDGNLIEDAANQYAWDDENRLARVTRKADNLVLARYRYDALGRRVAKHASTGGPVTETRYIYDRFRVIEEQDATHATVAEYVCGRDGDETLAMRRGGQVYFYHENAQSSIAAITDSAGVVLERYDYGPYGQSAVTDPAGVPLAGNLSSVMNPFRFTGQPLDGETGLMHFRSRVYHADLGRFLARDRIAQVRGPRQAIAGPIGMRGDPPRPLDGYHDGYNLYCAPFVPSHTDPMGEITWGRTFHNATYPVCELTFPHTFQCWCRTDLRVAPVVEVLDWMWCPRPKKIQVKCWRTQENYQRTVDHENAHVENINTVANRINQAEPQTCYEHHEECQSAADRMKKAFVDWFKTEMRHASTDPRSPRSAAPTIDAECAQSNAAGLCKVVNGPMPAKPAWIPD